MQRRWPSGLPADPPTPGRQSRKWRRIMKTLITALALATLIADPAFTLSGNAGPTNKSRDASQSGQDSGGTYPGYPTQWCCW